jgi:putative FmdB family regulatory protein
MPTYEYICKSCGHLFEIVQSMRDDPLTECPQCGGELRKVFTAPAIAFKGSGFYATDARKSSSRAGEPQDKKGSSTDGGTSKDSGSKDGGSKDGGSKAGDGGGEKKTTEKKTETKTGDSGKGSGSGSGSSD